jgi:glycine cleavage system regulatory protein
VKLEKTNDMLHTFVAYVEDLPGVLTRVASLFRRLNININSLTVGRSERPGLSRLTLVCEASAEAGHRIRPACLNWRMLSMWTTSPRRRPSPANWR